MNDPDQTTDAVVIERTLDAPVALVWQMWTDPEHFAAWYGPEGASIPVAKMDVQQGGSRHLCMEIQTPNGPHQMWFTGEYREVIDGERLVYTESMSDETGRVVPPAEMGMPDGHPEVTEVTVELRPTGGRTVMIMTHAGIPDESPGAAGWNMAFDKLTRHLDTLSR